MNVTRGGAEKKANRLISFGSHASRGLRIQGKAEGAAGKGVGADNSTRVRKSLAFSIEASNE
jgi:hypothetical protein